MLLKVGAAMMLLSLVLAAGVAVIVGLQDEASETAVLSSAEPRAAEATSEQKTSEQRRPDRGVKVEAEEEPQKEQSRRENIVSEAKKSESSLPAPIADWPKPKDSELAQLDEPRYFESVSGAAMTLTIEALNIYEVPVVSSDGQQALETGVAHVPGTSFPWDDGARRNVYLAGHYLGYPGTESRLIFYELDKLQSGDKITLEDREGRSYKYRVSEMFEVWPDDYWVMDQVRDRDIVTLQTCIPPDFGKRLIVRADRA